MFKINLKIENKDKCFYLDNVNTDLVDKISIILANNLSFNNENTKPEVVSCEEVEESRTPLFSYIGTECINLEPNQQTKYRKELLDNKILTGAIHNSKDGFITTELYKFKIIKE